MHQADREQLHHFARVVLVGTDVARRVGLLVLDVAEIDAHRRMQGHVFDQRAVVAEGVAAEHVVPARERPGLVGQRAVLARDDEDLAQRERDALAQLIGRQRKAATRVGRADGVDGPDLDPGRIGDVVVAFGLRRQGFDPVEVGHLQRNWLRELFCQPRIDAERAQARDVGRRRSEGGACEETRRGLVALRRIAAPLETVGE